MAGLSDRSVEIKVGAFVLGALALLVGFFLVVGNPTFGPGIKLRLDYAFTGPIKQGAAVKVSGVTVGKVQEVEFMGDRPSHAGADHPVVRLHVFIEQRAQPLLTEGTRFYVTTLGVLGEHYIDVVPGPANTRPIADGTTLRGMDLPRTDMLMARMAQILDQVGTLLDRNEVQLVDLIASASQLMRRLDKVMGETDMGQFLDDLVSTLTDARQVLEAARVVLKDPQGLSTAVQDAQKLVAQGKDSMADVRVLLTDVKEATPDLLRRTDELLIRADGMSVRVDSMLRALEKAGFTDEKRLAGIMTRSETVMDRADKLSVRADALLGRLERGEGTVGKLMKDEDVYNDLKALLREVRENPWRLMIPDRKK